MRCMVLAARDNGCPSCIGDWRNSGDVSPLLLASAWVCAPDNERLITEPSVEVAAEAGVIGDI